MKIGQFAKKHDTAPSAIRFYIELGLLLPQKKGAQYMFTDTEDFEMNLIRELKELGYSLKEMQKYISMVRLYEKKDAALLQNLLPLLKEKEHSLAEKKKEIESCLKKIHQKIQSLQETYSASSSNSPQDTNLGSVSVPVSFLSLLQCPQCGSSLQLSQASITASGITSSHMTCTCGYQAEIRDGMLFSGSLYDYEHDPDFSKCFFGTYKESASYDNFFFESSIYNSADLLVLQHKAFLCLQEKVHQMDSYGDILLIPDISCHLLYKLHQMPYIKNAFIIVLTFTPSSILPIQKYLKGLDLNLLYIINQDGHLPIQKKSVATILDYAGIGNFSFFNEIPFLDLYAPYVKDGGQLFSYTEYYDEHSKSLSIIDENYKFAVPSFMTWRATQKTLGRCQFKLTEKILLGSCDDPGRFWEYHHQGDKRYSICFQAEKYGSLKE